MTSTISMVRPKYLYKGCKLSRVSIDVLEQFQPKGAAQKQPAVAGTSSSGATPNLTASSSATNTQASSLESLGMDEDFMRELTQGMESLMREMVGGADPKSQDSDAPGSSAQADPQSPQTDEEKQRMEGLHTAWEKMFMESMNGALNMEGKTEDAAGASSTESSGGHPAPAQDSFEASIRKAMEKLKESETNLKVCVKVPLHSLRNTHVHRFSARRTEQADL